MDRPFVALDMDGVLANFIDRLLRTFNERFGGSLEHDRTTVYMLEDAYPDEFERLEAIWGEPGFFASLDVYQGARGFVEDLVAGADVEVCSQSPLRKLSDGRRVMDPHAAADKLGWLARHFPALAENVTLTHKKSRLRADVLVDDNPKHVRAWAVSHPAGFGVLVDRPWSRKHLFEMPSNVSFLLLEDIPASIQAWWRDSR